MNDDAGRAHLPIPGEPEWRGRGAPRWRYTPELGEAIAREYAESVTESGDGTRASRDGGLWGLHYAFPERIPPPSVVRAWCGQYPAFGTLMREAEKLRAERLMEEAVVIADTAPGHPARVRLQMDARYRLAEALDRPRWGGTSAGGTNAPALPRPGEQPVALSVSDDELEALVAAQLATAGAGAGGGEPPA